MSIMATGVRWDGLETEVILRRVLLDDHFQPVRNPEMVAAAAEMCFTFHRFLAGCSGTKDCVRRALEAGIPTYLIDSEATEQRQLRADDERLS
jgi:hypothetical protein